MFSLSFKDAISRWFELKIRKQKTPMRKKLKIILFPLNEKRAKSVCEVRTANSAILQQKKKIQINWNDIRSESDRIAIVIELEYRSTVLI